MLTHSLQSFLGVFKTEPATPVGVTVAPESTTEVKVGWTADSKYEVSLLKKYHVIVINLI